MRRTAFLVIPLAVMLFLGCNFKVNKSIYVDDGESVRSSLNTVNGSISIGTDCRVDGGCRSVNGDIEVGAYSRVEDLQAVNGGIDIEREVVVRGDVESVNGSVYCEEGTEVSGTVSTVNGGIDLENTLVKRDLTTYNGDILLSDETTVVGDIIVKKNRGRSHRRHPLRIEIRDNSVVQGDIIVKDRDIEVIVELSSGGRVEGRVRNAEVVER